MQRKAVRSRVCFKVIFPRLVDRLWVHIEERMCLDFWPEQLVAITVLLESICAVGLLSSHQLAKLCCSGG